MTGYGENNPSAADIYMITAGGGFLQIGWYVGQTEALPDAATPRVFFGENVPGTSNELLQAGPVIGWGVTEPFSIYSEDNYYWHFYANSVCVGQSAYEHATTGSPSFNGEVDYQNTTMWGEALGYSSPYKTLQYQATYGGPWTYFTDHYFGNVYGFSSASLGYQATDFANGGYSCT